ncbi:family 78 glycoside hydrolase catalytic domain [Bifidobacterium favimelis]|uniref:alpha-L-rhamnosidase n=1 Tax=Bifidobacterium favimelis TaxID=3122979 RepID=A0ABU8ZL31_9BIFI
MTTQSTTLAVSRVRFGHRQAADRVLGYGDPRPSLSWRVVKAPEGWEQAGAQVEISDGRGDPEIHDLEGDGQVCRPWPGRPLGSGRAARVRVRVAGHDGAWSSWSPPAQVETGLLKDEDWRGAPITPATPVGRLDPAPVMAVRFRVEGECARARLHLTSGGIFAAYLDGRRIGRDQLTPGWTDYRKRLNALTYDVTGSLTPGEHELAVILGNGWYRGQLTWTCRTEVYGSRLWLLSNLDWEDARGGHCLATDGGWTWRPSAILANDLYDGQMQDMRVPLLNPSATGGPVETIPMPRAAIRPQEAPPAVIIRRLPGRRLVLTPSGGKIVDFGQNVAGWVRLHVRSGRPGDQVVLRHAEVLEDGELGTRPLRKARATDRFILSGGEEDLEPIFTQHGFRYVQVEGVDDLRPEDLEACVVSADMESLASFSSSRPELDRLFENVRWSTRANFITIPTDCPQRDERLGWTGDIAVFSPTAMSLYDAGDFLDSWLEDVAGSQAPDGGIPVVVPDVLDGPKLTCGWGDASVLVPWAVYQATGDAGVLRRFLPMMDRFVDGVESLTRGTHLWRGGFQYGDWLDPDAPPDDPGRSKADPDVIATAYFAHSARLVSAAHMALGQAEEGRRYGRLADQIGHAFRDQYVTEGGAVLSDCASVYAVALVWDLLETPEQRRGAGDRLADIVRVSGFRISTGFLGTPLICPALVMSGHGDLAVRLLLQDRCPSWLYPVRMGATTVWERWDSMLPDGSINPGQMTSFNHYALGAIAHWMMTGLAGLRMEEAGWRRVSIAPVIDRALAHVEVAQETPYGLIRVKWEVRGKTLHLEAVLPVGIRARVRLPEVADRTYGEGSHSWDLPMEEVCPRKGPMLTIRDLIDSASAMEKLEKALAASGSQAYQGEGADLTFTEGAARWLDADVALLPQVASRQGYLPEAGAIEEACRTLLRGLPDTAD